MNSRLLTCRVQHQRFTPKEHSFSYPLYTCLFDIDELPLLNTQLRLFGHNKKRLLSLHDADYLERGSETIRTKLTHLFSAKNVELRATDTVFLVTSARFLNYAFNPVCFYWIFRDEALHGCAAEVNNTFGEKHIYILPGSGSMAKKTELSQENDTSHPTASTDVFPAQYSSPKQFHVSPFMDMQGSYAFSFEDIRQTLDVTVTLYHDTTKAFEATLIEEERFPLTDATLLKTVVTKPFTTHLTMPRILWQAGKIHLGKGIRYHPKPEPDNDMTIRHKTTISRKDKLAFAIIKRVLNKVRYGQLTLILPDDTSVHFTGTLPGPTASISVHSYALFRNILLHGDIGLGEGYTQKLWESEDVVSLIQFFLKNRKIYATSSNFLQNIWAYGTGLVRKQVHATAPHNDQAGSKANIAAHYDLSNDLFRCFLDPTLTYSCALFLEPDNVHENLTEAQLRKNRELADKVGISATDHVLEVGCGWGGFAEQTAKERGCKVTGVTLSQEQYDYATQRIQQAGLEHLVDIQLLDYRNLTSQYDKIVSIEMLEAVGHKFHAEYFQQLEKLLNPKGKIAIQTITIKDSLYSRYCCKTDWLRKHIFPGGELPSLSRICTVVSGNTGLALERVDAYGQHYANTLSQWREKFNTSWSDVEQLGFDEKFKRTWNYYLASCEAGFLQGHIDDLHILLAHAEHTLKM